MDIQNIGVHHFAGVLSLAELNRTHKAEWPDLPSKLRPDLYVGYNIVIWQDGTYLQTRYLGEETAAQKGHNFDTVSISLCGNFSINQPTYAQKQTLAFLAGHICEGKAQEIGLKILPGTTINVPRTNIFPHRVLQPNHTECYGSLLSDAWARELVYPPVQVSPAAPIVFATSTPIEDTGPQGIALLLSWERLLQLWKSIFGHTPFGSTHRSCYQSARG